MGKSLRVPLKSPPPLGNTTNSISGRWVFWVPPTMRRQQLGLAATFLLLLVVLPVIAHQEDEWLEIASPRSPILHHEASVSMANVHWDGNERLVNRESVARFDVDLQDDDAETLLVEPFQVQDLVQARGRLKSPPTPPPPWNDCNICEFQVSLSPNPNPNPN